MTRVTGKQRWDTEEHLEEAKSKQTQKDARETFGLLSLNTSPLLCRGAQSSAGKRKDVGHQPVIPHEIPHSH